MSLRTASRRRKFRVASCCARHRRELRDLVGLHPLAVDPSRAPIERRAQLDQQRALGVEEEDRKRIWLEDAESFVSRGCPECARAVYTQALTTFPTKKSVWLRAAQHEKACGNEASLDALLRKAQRENLTPCVRLNGSTGINFNRPLGSKRVNIFEMYSDLQFYDYTESIKQMRKYLRGELPSNYHLTYSRKENNWAECEEVLDAGGNVAAVFGILKREALPDQYRGYRVIDADQDDLRFRDPSGVICGLRPKGKRQALERDRMLLSGMAIHV